MRVWQQLKNIYHFFQAYYWRTVYGWPDRGLTLYGVTGTNGKTTTCHVLASILQQQYGVDQVGMLTTIAFWFGEEKKINETKMTTLPSRAVFAYLARMKKQGVKHVVVEVTSHALDQHRLAGIKLDGAIILNIAREHLDYHRTMAQYAQAKGEIVGYLKANSPLVVKGDDEWIRKLLSGLRIIPPLDGTPPLAVANYPASGRDPAFGGGQLRLIKFTSTDAADVVTPLAGDVNKENVLAASLFAKAVGVSAEPIAAGVARMTAIPGRMQWVDLPTGAQALIDYAVTPDALERLYKDLRAKTPGKIYAILGACGLRDRGKRPDMARVVAKYATQLVLTREDPWTESEEQIFQDLEKGLQITTTPWQRMTDRREALKYCLERATKGDVVVATGKGAETGMGIGKEVVPWNEKKIILELASAVSNAK